MGVRRSYQILETLGHRALVIEVWLTHGNRDLSTLPVQTHHRITSETFYMDVDQQCLSP